MTKRIICLLLAVMMFAALPFAGALAAPATVDHKIGAETLKMICDAQGLDYEFCKAAIVKLNGWADETVFSTLTVGTTIKLPKTNQDAADVLGVALPSTLLPKSTGETQTYTVVNKDTLIGICTKLHLNYDKCKAAIMKLNGWNDTNLLTLHVGDKIILPKSDADAPALAAATGTAAASTVPVTLWGSDAIAAYMVPHVVKTGETLYGICVENGVDFNRYINLIMSASGLKSATIYTGDIVYIPSGTATTGSLAVISHVVTGGETVYGICQALGINYNLRYNLIVALNPTKNINNIHTGDVLYLPSGSGTATGTGTGTGTGTAATGTGTGGGAYTPAAAVPPVTQTNPKAKEGVMFYIKEYTVVADDTVYSILKAQGLDMQYFNYYTSAMLAANNIGSFNLKAGDKLLIASPTAAGAKMAITGFKVKTGDMTEALCNAKGNGIKYSDAGIPNLIVKLNPSLNVNNLHVDDILLLPVKP